ncbi:MAG: hypothetical protein ABL949_11945 [Fimbriimonadaceae bacterium]
MIDFRERMIPTQEELSSGLRLLIKGGKIIEMPGRLYYAGTGSTEFEHLTQEEFDVALDQYYNKFNQALAKLKSDHGMR